MYAEEKDKSVKRVLRGGLAMNYNEYDRQSMELWIGRVLADRFKEIKTQNRRILSRCKLNNTLIYEVNVCIPEYFANLYILLFEE